MDSERKLILDLCAGTGAWSKPYRDHGYEVELVTLPAQDVRTYKSPSKGVYGVLVAPPCNSFSLGNVREMDWRKRDVAESLEIVQACLRIIWTVKPEWWALENPVGYLNRFLGRPGYTFRACDFGDPWEKRTYLWGWFNPPQRLNVRPVDALHTVKGDRSRIPKGFESVIGRANRRAITPPGFAYAFFLANQ